MTDIKVGNTVIIKSASDPQYKVLFLYSLPGERLGGPEKDTPVALLSGGFSVYLSELVVVGSPEHTDLLEKRKKSNLRVAIDDAVSAIETAKQAIDHLNKLMVV